MTLRNYLDFPKLCSVYVLSVLFGLSIPETGHELQHSLTLYLVQLSLQRLKYDHTEGIHAKVEPFSYILWKVFPFIQCYYPTEG